MSKRFYDTIRPLFRGGALAQEQKAGVERILAGCRKARLPRQQAAYVLATAFWETGQKMRPVEENLKYSAHRLREVWPSHFTAEEAEHCRGMPQLIANKAYANRMGNGPESTGDGYRYRGRGLVQITGKGNYAKLGQHLGLPLVEEPNIAMAPDTAVDILVGGMRLGLFTGVSLDDVSEPATSQPNFTDDRKVVNGNDRAREIAKSADVFFASLEDVDLLADSRTIKAAKKSKVAAKGGGFLSVLLAVLGGAADYFANNPTDAIAGAKQSMELSDVLGIGLPIAGVVLFAIFLVVHAQAQRAEDARREDNEVNGL